MKSGHAKQTAFTIVELLIVIVVIAILAAISVVAYNGIQDRANDAAVHSDAAKIQKKMELAKIDLGHYPHAYIHMPELKLTKSAYATDSWNVHFCYSAASDEYALSLRSKSDTSVVVTKDIIKEEPGQYGNDPTCSELSGSVTWANKDSGWAGYNHAGSYWLQNWNWTAD